MLEFQGAKHSEFNRQENSLRPDLKETELSLMLVTVTAGCPSAVQIVWSVLPQ